MSGMLFSLLLAGLSLKMLHDVLIGEFGLREISEGVWRGHIREGNHSVEVHIRVKGDEILFLLPNRSIPPDVCDQVVKHLAAKLYALVARTDMPPERVEIVGPANSFCYYCLSPVYMPFRCNRCGGYFCAEHRLPEKHNCPGDKEQGASAEQKKSVEEPEEHIDRKIVVRVIACG